MPTRLLRDGILTSERVNALSVDAELFYRRLMSAADDFGRYFASPALLRAALYPLRTERVTLENIAAWLTECVTADLCRQWSCDGKSYLEILGFSQRVRSTKSKFPEPPSGSTSLPTDSSSLSIARDCPQPADNGGQLPRSAALVGDEIGDEIGDAGEKAARACPQTAAQRGQMPADTNSLYEGFQVLLMRWPNPTGVDFACQLWMSYVDAGEITEELIPEIFAGLERWKHSEQWATGKQHSMSTWLQKKLWKDQPKRDPGDIPEYRPKWEKPEKGDD
ncbi:MAG: hypothetical protein ABFD89_16840 [Bryobacteraceae bacterium]